MTGSAPARGRARRQLAVCLSVAVGLGVSNGLVASPAVAATGPAPTPATRTVIADVHTDAVSTWFENGSLVLDSKADVPATGTRYPNDAVWFHVDNDSRIASWPGGAPTFVAPSGSTVWLAPMTQVADQIWPGFSTEAISTGVLKDNDITLTLQSVNGPGDVELWTTGSFGEANRIWSSDESFKSFTRKNNVHMHANWAFTKPGIYELTVRGTAVVAATDQPTADTAVYTFVVGELPQKVSTSTALQASASSLPPGGSVTLTAAVSPASQNLDGAVEFRDGSTVLGHDPINGTGVAQLIVPGLALGTHDIRAVFVPKTSNLATGSTSAPVSVTVTEGSGAVTTRLSAANARQVYGKSAQLTVSVSPQATGLVGVRVGSQTVTGQLVGGKAKLTLPARALEPGNRVVKLGYAGVEGQFLPANGTATVRVVKAKPEVKVQVLTESVKRGKKAKFRITVDGAGVTPTGEVAVSVGGQKKVLELNRQGRAVAKILIPARIKPGSTQVFVAYRGDARVADDPRTTASIRVTK